MDRNEKLKELNKEQLLCIFKDSCILSKLISCVPEDLVDEYLGSRYSFNLSFEENINTLCNMAEELLSKKGVNFAELVSVVRDEPYYKMAQSDNTTLKVSVLNDALGRLTSSLGCIDVEIAMELAECENVDPLFRDPDEYKSFLDKLNKIIV